MLIFFYFSSNWKRTILLNARLSIKQKKCHLQVVNREIREKLKNHNYCRNPNPNRENRPWCFTGPRAEREHCDIPPCGNIGIQQKETFLNSKFYQCCLYQSCNYFLRYSKTFGESMQTQAFRMFTRRMYSIAMGLR